MKTIWCVLLCSMFLVNAKMAEQYGQPEQRFQTIQQKLSLFEFLNVIYTNKIVIDCPDFETIEYKTARYQKLYIPVYAFAGKYEEQIRQCFMSETYIKWINNRVGYGLFATHNIAAGQLIGMYTGAITLRPYIRKGDTRLDFAWAYPIKHPNDFELIIDAKWCGNELRFLNYSLSPNCRFVYLLVDAMYVLCCIAAYDIAADEEITIARM